MKNLFVLFLLSVSLFAHAQNETFFKIKKYQTAVLSDSVNETSGLDFFKGHLLTFNDSGNSAEIFEIDKNSGKILKIIQTELKNKDWEAITADENHIYVGDFGNNKGKRKDLTIYELQTNNSLEVESVEKISFFYPEQTNFESQNRKHNFDAEAMVFIKGKIHLFTKEWKSKKTNHYVINPSIKENQPAKKLEKYNVGFLVTDASYYKEKLYLIGYTKKMEVYLMIFNEDKHGFFFNSKPKKYYLGQSSTIGQIEGITVNEDGIYISGEAMKYAIFDVDQSFYFIPQKDIQ